MTEWPLVAINDDGIRPAGKQDECFYCQQKVGSEHKRDCVIVTKKVKIKYSFFLEEDVPYSWDKRFIEFHRNDGTWCTSNLLPTLQKIEEDQGCLCLEVEAEFIEVVDDTPRRELNDEIDTDNFTKQ